MKLTNRKIVNTVNSIGIVGNRSLPIKASYAISKNLLKLEKEAEIYNLEREKLLDKYSEKDENGNRKVGKNGNVIIKKEHIEDWNREITELLDIEVEIDIHKFALAVLDHVEISPQELMAIDFMIEE